MRNRLFAFMAVMLLLAGGVYASQCETGKKGEHGGSKELVTIEGKITSVEIVEKSKKDQTWSVYVVDVKTGDGEVEVVLGNVEVYKEAGVTPKKRMEIKVEGWLEMDGIILHLSRGAKDRLFLALRLALAQVLGEETERRLPLLLDDPLANWDDQALADGLQTLGRLGQRDDASIIIFTCHRSRCEQVTQAAGGIGSMIAVSDLRQGP